MKIPDSNDQFRNDQLSFVSLNELLFIKGMTLNLAFSLASAVFG